MTLCVPVCGVIASAAATGDGETWLGGATVSEPPDVQPASTRASPAIIVAVSAFRDLRTIAIVVPSAAMSFRDTFRDLRTIAMVVPSAATSFRNRRIISPTQTAWSPFMVHRISRAGDAPGACLVAPNSDY